MTKKGIVGEPRDGALLAMVVAIRQVGRRKKKVMMKHETLSSN
jgi:hypothetical protein